jgi:glycosyltransferase involved in cell wall biosynthesis
LHVLSQRPEKTGSGIYLSSLIKESARYGQANFLVAGVPAGKLPVPGAIEYDAAAYVMFESDMLDFPVPGMSDVMPYYSSLFTDLKDQCLAQLMTHAHVQVLPSFFEGLPLVLFEGLASGCRIITTDLTGFAGIFGKARKDTIDLIPLPPLETIDRPYHQDEAPLERVLCDSILQMIDSEKTSPDFDDPAVDKIASEFTWPRVFERTLAVYADAVARKDHSG